MLLFFFCCESHSLKKSNSCFYFSDFGFSVKSLIIWWYYDRLAEPDIIHLLSHTLFVLSKTCAYITHNATQVLCGNTGGSLSDYMQRLLVPQEALHTFYINCNRVYTPQLQDYTQNEPICLYNTTAVCCRDAANLHVAAETRRSRTWNIHTPHNRPAVHQSSSVTHILDSSDRPADADESWIWMRGREMMCCDIKSHCAQEFGHSQNSTRSVFQDGALHIPDTSECVFNSQWTLY